MQLLQLRFPPARIAFPDKAISGTRGAVQFARSESSARAGLVIRAMRKLHEMI